MNWLSVEDDCRSRENQIIAIIRLVEPKVWRDLRRSEAGMRRVAVGEKILWEETV